MAHFPHVYLIGIEFQNSSQAWSAKESIAELSELSRTAKLHVVGTMIQSRITPDPRTYLGKGKIQDLQTIITDLQVEVLIADDELSPAQQQNLEKALNIKIMDRTSLVLEIFSQRAKSHEAKLQVELAQLNYLFPRLTRMWTHLSRLGGGIGTRGPGETQLETDKRQIKLKIAHLNKAVKKVQNHRQLLREKRHNTPFITVAIVGYTNAGKSTLFNTLCQAKVVAQNQLFATLDPTTRRLKLPNKEDILMCDTVGFIQKLPHHLINAFRATLEEALHADFILHVVDVSHPKYQNMIETSNQILSDLGVSDTPQLLVFNKVDLIHDSKTLHHLTQGYQQYTICSAKDPQKISDVLQSLQDLLSQSRQTMSFHIPYDRMDIVHLLHEKADIISESYDSDIEITANINTTIGQKIMGDLHGNHPESLSHSS